MYGAIESTLTIKYFVTIAKCEGKLRVRFFTIIPRFNK